MCRLYLALCMCTRTEGIPSYNDVRQACGFARVTTFQDITSDDMIQRRLADAYGDVELLDAYTGALAETEDGSGLFGGPLLRVRAARGKGGRGVMWLNHGVNNISRSKACLYGSNSLDSWEVYQVQRSIWAQGRCMYFVPDFLYSS